MMQFLLGSIRSNNVCAQTIPMSAMSVVCVCVCVILLCSFELPEIQYPILAFFALLTRICAASMFISKGLVVGPLIQISRKSKIVSGAFYEESISHKIEDVSDRRDIVDIHFYPLNT